MQWGDIVREGDSPSFGIGGIGGKANVIWHCCNAASKIYELKTTDFSVDRQGSAPGGVNFGIGGDENTIWHCCDVSDKIYELLITDFSVDRQADAPSGKQTGIGGTLNIIWSIDYTGGVYELNIIDLTVYREDTVSFWPQDIGGNKAVIWATDWGEENNIYMHELITRDFSVIRTVAVFDSNPYEEGYGVGGSRNIIWNYNGEREKIYELYVEVENTIIFSMNL